jgi:hypothetical protein
MVSFTRETYCTDGMPIGSVKVAKVCDTLEKRVMLGRESEPAATGSLKYRNKYLYITY